MSQKVRILVAKPGLDGHDRGAKVVARALRDAGFEVIYTGLHQTPEMIASAAVQEDVDAVGLSIMSGAHNTLFPAVVEALRAKGAGDIKVFGGGIIPNDDFDRLRAAGVASIFTPGTPLAAIIDWVKDNVKPSLAFEHGVSGQPPAPEDFGNSARRRVSEVLMRIGRCEAEQDLYAILELSPGASAADIRRAHRRLALRYHPDRGAMGAEAEQRMKAVNFAASVLLHPSARARYDALRGQAPRAPRTRSWCPAARSPKTPASSGPVVAPAALRRPGRHVPAVAAFFSVALSLTLLVGCVADAFAGPAPVASSRYRIPKGPTMETPWAR